ncbi:hypothetical protein C8J56DRAFT_1166610 [Mycena floridula]|nr:hypothetical protein C8J56DRAFT_1166610 [Mycena floridula]
MQFRTLSQALVIAAALVTAAFAAPMGAASDDGLEVFGRDIQILERSDVNLLRRNPEKEKYKPFKVLKCKDCKMPFPDTSKGAADLKKHYAHSCSGDIMGW